MKKTLIIVGIILLIQPVFCYPQNWVGLSTGVDNQASTLQADSNTHSLFLGGVFQYADSDSILVNGVARWDGQRWHALGNGIHSGTRVYSFELFNDTVFAGGLFQVPISYNGIYKWTGTSWDSVGAGINDVVECMTVYNNELYAGGLFTNAGGFNTQGVAKWNGYQWSGFPFVFQDSVYYVTTICFYQNNLYFGGNFYYGPGMREMCYWDGNTMQSIGGGIQGFATGVNCMAVYNNELYISGSFRTADGNAGNNIMKWDGISLSDVGGGSDEPVRALKVFNNELYAIGDFYNIGGIPACHIAKWNGTSWSSVGHSIFNNNLSAIEFLDGELYVAGGFNFIDSLPVNFVAKYTGPLSVNEIDLSSQITIYPNPANDMLQIKSQKYRINKITIHDVPGKEIYSEENTGTDYCLDISFLNSGIYFLTLETGKEKVVKKFVKK